MHLYRKRVIKPLLAAAGLIFAATLPVTSAPANESKEVPAAMNIFVFVYRAGPTWKPGRPMSEQGLAAHGAYMKRLFVEGRIHAAGALGPEGGLVILYAHDLAGAEAMLAADPAIRTGIFTGEVRLWNPRFRSEHPIAQPAR